MPAVNSSRGNLIFFLVLAGLLIGYQLVLRPYLASQQGANHPGIGTKLTYVSLESLDQVGPPLELSDLAGKVVLLNYWATWCGPCVQEFPHLMNIHDKFADQPDFKFVSISCPSGGQSRDDLHATTAQFLTTMQAQVPVYYDPQQATFNMVASATGAQHAIPTTLVLDGQGTIRGLWQGFSPDMETEIEQLIRSLLPN